MDPKTTPVIKKAEIYFNKSLGGKTRPIISKILLERELKPA